MAPRAAENAISLHYPGKAPEGEIYAVEPADLEVVREFGPPAADGWRNMLVWGDNLRVLRALLDDGRVRGRVTLVYIDPRSGRAQRTGGGGTSAPPPATRWRTATRSSARSTWSS